MPKAMPIEDRFWRHVLRAGSDECWEWQAALTRDGYGSFWNGEYNHERSRFSPVMVLAHRWSYERFVGPIPDGLSVLHHCDHPPCVNPRHLWPGTQADNIHDCEAKGRRNQRHYKIPSAVRDEIRARYGAVIRGEAGPTPRGSGSISQSRLAEEYGVSQPTIGAILRETGVNIA